MKNNNCSVIIGGYVNGYSIIQELYDNGVEDIFLVDVTRQIASFSNKISGFYKTKLDSLSILKILQELHKTYQRIIIFPTADNNLIELSKIFCQISEYCYIPFNHDKIDLLLDKGYQYNLCEKFGIPIPKTITMTDIKHLNNLNELMYPLIVKPIVKANVIKPFRAFMIGSESDIRKYTERLKSALKNGAELMASEYIPGPDSNIYSYVFYRENESIISEWQGRKLSQFPKHFGVFSSSSNSAPPEVKELGRIIAEKFDLIGIIEPEFKYDDRDQQYKLMEITLRPTMWHRIGYLSGVKMLYNYYLEGIGEKSLKFEQNTSSDIHYVYLTKEIANLFTQWEYLKTLKYNLRNSDKTILAIYDKRDIKPFLFDLFRNTLKDIIKYWTVYKK